MTAGGTQTGPLRPDSLSEPRKVLNLLGEQHLLGAVHRRLWTIVDEVLHDNSSLTRTDKAFFTMTAKAHYDCAIFHLAKLFDQDRDGKTVCLEHFLKCLQVHPEALAGVADVAEDRLGEVMSADLKTLKDPKVSSLRRHRNKVYAHLDAPTENNPALLFNEYPFCDADVGFLYDLALGILDRYFFWFAGHPCYRVLEGEGNTKFLLDILARSLAVVEAADARSADLPRLIEDLYELRDFGLAVVRVGPNLTGR